MFIILGDKRERCQLRHKSLTYISIPYFPIKTHMQVKFLYFNGKGINLHFDS